MKKILRLLIVFCFLFFFVYYVQFLVQYSLPFSVSSSIGFFKGLTSAPITLIRTLTPGSLPNIIMKQFEPQNDVTLFDIPLTEDEVVDNKMDLGAVYGAFYDFAKPSTEEVSREWSWKVDMLVGDVLGKDLEKKIVGLNVTVPERSGSDRLMALAVECSESNSILVGTHNLEILEAGVDFLNLVERGDTVFAFCTNAECFGIGRGCVVVKDL